MNIFWLDNDLPKAVKYHNNSHTVKQILEYAQLLSTTHHILDGDTSPVKDRIYKKTHANHPCAKWVRESSANYLQLHNLLTLLCQEYTHRYGKIHKVERELLDTLANLPLQILHGDLTDYPVCMPDEVKITIDNGKFDVVASYRNYYITRKTHLAKWKNRDVPEWHPTPILTGVKDMDSN